MEAWGNGREPEVQDEGPEATRKGLALHYHPACRASPLRVASGSCLDAGGFRPFTLQIFYKLLRLI
ncbi:MAG TPA: hypothetical protein VFA41_16480 [Ktedonobacteraceae bacterium]|nr:hypothetical protein [Ktedonobacteraceae bacterium]